MSMPRKRMTQQVFPFVAKVAHAELSPCGTYRYTLTRSLDELDWDAESTEAAPRKTVLFVMLNPSTANAEENDPTVNKCIKIARHSGYQRLQVTNLYAFRATDPKNLWKAAFEGTDIIGPENFQRTDPLIRAATTVVCAWGKGGLSIQEKFQADYQKLPLYCLRHNLDRTPAHPLYQRDDSELMLFSPRP